MQEPDVVGMQTLVPCAKQGRAKQPLPLQISEPRTAQSHFFSAHEPPISTAVETIAATIGDRIPFLARESRPRVSWA